MKTTIFILRALVYDAIFHEILKQKNATLAYISSLDKIKIKKLEISNMGLENTTYIR